MNDITKSNLSFFEGKTQTLKKNIGNNMWELGTILKDLKESGIYKVRKPFWDEYCKEVLHFSRRTADNLIALTKNYNRQLVAKWGSTKLTLLLERFDEEERAEYIKTHNPTNTSKTDIIKATKKPKKATFRKIEREEEPSPQKFVNIRAKSFLDETMDMVLLLAHKVDGIAINFVPDLNDYPKKDELITMLKTTCKKLEALDDA